MNGSFRLLTVTAVGAVMAMLVSGVSAGTQDFSTDPEWVGEGNTEGGNSYGYSSSSFAGGTAGEAGGTLARVNTGPSYYGAVGIGSFTLDDTIEGEGKFSLRNITDWDAPGSSGFFIGHFTTNTFDRAFIGLEFKEGDGSTARVRARLLVPNGAGGADSGVLAVPIDRELGFRYVYDPSLGEHGRLTVTVKRAADLEEKVEVDLNSGERGCGAVFDAFGLGMEPSMNSENEPGRHIDVYLDDVVYTGTGGVSVPKAVPSEFVLVAGADGGGVTNDFWVGQNEVSVAEYVEFLNAAETGDELSLRDGQVYRRDDTERYCLTGAAGKAHVRYDESAAVGQRFSAASVRATHPMISVSWFGAAAFCNWKSTQAGRTAVYDPENRWTAGLAANGYRLPTEAEWYKAVAWDTRLGAFKVYGTGANSLEKADANYLDSGDPFETAPVRTTPVGSYAKQSPYGLRDASGNVWEWCQDFYKDGAANPATATRAMRGGSWGNHLANLKTTSRAEGKPDDVRTTVGFRVVTSAGPDATPAVPTTPP